MSDTESETKDICLTQGHSYDHFHSSDVELSQCESIQENEILAVRDDKRTIIPLKGRATTFVINNFNTHNFMEELRDRTSEYTNIHFIINSEKELKALILAIRRLRVFPFMPKVKSITLNYEVRV